MENTNHFDVHTQQPPDRLAGNVAASFAKLQVGKMSRELKVRTKQLADTETEMAQTSLSYLSISDGYEVPLVSEPGRATRPTRFTEHQRLRSFYLGGELASYSANLVLLTLLTTLYLSISWQAKVAVITALFAVIWQVVPALFAAAFEIQTKTPESIRPIKRILLVGGLIAFGGLAAFYISRASDESEGFISMLYNNSLTLAEVGFGVCAACFNILRKFYSWSLTHTSQYEKLMARADELRASIATLKDRLAAHAPTTPSNGGADHVN